MGDMLISEGLAQVQYMYIICIYLPLFTLEKVTAFFIFLMSTVKINQLINE